MPWIAGCLIQLATQVIAQTLRDAVPERALQLAAEVGRRCGGWASGVLGAVDCWLSGAAGHSSARAVIAKTCETRFPVTPNSLAGQDWQDWQE